MKVLHISYWGHGGAGGAMAARRLHFGLRNAGIDSTILCMQNPDEVFHMTQFRPSKVEKLLNPVFRKVTSYIGLNNVFDISSLTIAKNPAYLDADVLSIHNFTNFFSYLALPSLTRDKPTVLTLHDMVNYTGHCYVSYDCERWKTGCGRCPYPDVFPPIRRDATRIEWRLKNWAYSRSNLDVVTLSSERTDHARQSILKRFPIHHIPLGVDTEAYKPLDSEECRSLLGIAPQKKVLMFMAKSLHSPVKGGDLLVGALRELPPSLKANTVLLLLGNEARTLTKSVDIQTLDLGYVSSDRLKSICYSAADLFIHPTRADTFPVVLVESIACGTPMVSYRVGGVPDIVRPGITGYLAEQEDVKGLSNGIVQLLEDESLRHSMRENCRAIAVEEYSIELQVERYIKLYRQLLFGTNHPTEREPESSNGNETAARFRDSTSIRN